MGAGNHGGFGATKGSRHRMNLQLFANKAFDEHGYVTEKSLADHREYFWGKSVAKIEKILNKLGYKTERRPSIHHDSKSKIIVTKNHSKQKNITQVQVSPGSKRHGFVPYVKISTSDHGRVKLVNAYEEDYKSDGNEKAKIYFKRRRKK